MIKNINILIFFILPFASVAQSDKIQKEAIKLFSSSVSNIRKLSLTGFKDGGIEIELYLVNNDDDWKGICYYPSSHEKIKLAGGIVEGNLILDEFDYQNEIIGMWLIDINDERYNAKWRNVSGSKSFDIEFRQFDKLPEPAVNTVRFYKGKLLNDSFEIILSKDYNNKLKANLINIRQNKYLKNNIGCLDPQCDSFNIGIKDNKIKKLLCNKNDDSNIDITVISKAGTQFKSTVKEVNRIEIANKSFINKKYSLNISYPVFNNKKINNSLNQELNSIIDSLEEEMERLFFESYDFDNRLTLQVYGWFDIDYYSNDFFSARLIIQKSYSEQTKCFPINIYLKTGKKIKVRSQFSQDFNFDFFTIQFLKEYIKDLPDYRSPMVRNYLKSDNFKYITINKTGIVFSTEFNNIFGTYKIIIPYSYIQKELKRRSILQKIIKL